MKCEIMARGKVPESVLNQHKTSIILSRALGLVPPLYILIPSQDMKSEIESLITRGKVPKKVLNLLEVSISSRALILVPPNYILTTSIFLHFPSFIIAECVFRNLTYVV